LLPQIHGNEAVQISLLEDSYRVRLAEKPIEDVTIIVSSVPTATDRETPSSWQFSGDYSERVQVELPAGASLEGATTIEGDDRLDVLSIPSNHDGVPFRTLTSVHEGNGNDHLTVVLYTNAHDGVVFIAS
jgi:hypothetical protein